MPWRNARDLSNAELRDFAATLAADLVHFRQTLALLTAYVLSESDEIETPPEDVRAAMLDGLKHFMDVAMDVRTEEEQILREFKLREHLNN